MLRQVAYSFRRRICDGMRAGDRRKNCRRPERFGNNAQVVGWARTDGTMSSCPACAWSREARMARNYWRAIRLIDSHCSNRHWKAGRGAGALLLSYIACSLTHGGVSSLWKSTRRIRARMPSLRATHTLGDTQVGSSLQGGRPNFDNTAT